MPSTSFHAMGSKIMVVADGDGPEVRTLLGKVRGWFVVWEACLSRFRPESELNLLNQRAGQSVVVSEALWAVLQGALEAARQTNGLITPTILPALEAAGYDRTFQEMDSDEGGKTQPKFQPGPILAHPPPVSEIQTEPATHCIILPKGMRLDLGGFAKGWAADESARRLGEIAPALVDAGGDIAVSGPRADGSAWPVGIGHPQNPRQNLAVMELTSGGLATSGRNYRQWVKDGQQQHHLIDPRTGLPAKTDIITVSVIAASALEAETAAKMVLILGSEAGKKWLQERHLKGVIVLNDQVRYI